MKVAVIVPEPERANVREIIAALRPLGFREEVIRETILPYTAQDRERPSKEWKTDDGWVTVRYYGLSRFGLEHYSGNRSVKRVSTPHPRRYSRSIPDLPESRKERKTIATQTAKRGVRRQAEPEPQEAANGFDASAYLDKPFSPTMEVYLDWAEEQLGDLEKIDADRLFVLGTQLYGHFQKSDMNVKAREERRAARQAPAAEQEPEPAAPARRGRARGGAAAEAAPAPARGRGGRGRSRNAPASSGEEAPY